MATVGIEWIYNYHGIVRDLPNSQRNATGFSQTLDAALMFEHFDDHSVETNFEHQVEAGGALPSAESADLVYFSGHGIPHGPIFGVKAGPAGDFVATPERMRLGQRLCKWIVFDACLALSRELPTLWHTRLRGCFAGLHYLFGFDTVASDSAERGRLFAQKLNDNQPIREAWMRACIETEESDRRYAYVRSRIEGSDSFHDHWIGHGFVSDPIREEHEQSLFYLRSHC